ARARAQGVRVLCYWRDRVPNAPDLLATAIADESPRVRLEAVRALSFFNGADVPKATSLTYEAVKKPMDTTLEYCFKETLKQLQSLSKEKTLPTDPELLAMLISKMDDKDLDSQPNVEAVLKAKLERRSYDVVKRTSVINELAKLHKTDKVAELIAAYQAFDASANTAASNELTKVLVGVPQADLAKSHDALVSLAAKAKRPEVRKAAWAGILIGDGKADGAWEVATSVHATEAIIQAIAVVPNPALRAEFQPKLTAALANASGGTLKAILAALPLMGPANASANFAVLAKNLIEGKERNTAVDAIRQLPHESWDKAQAAAIAESLLAYAKTVPQNKRTEQDFVELTQLGIDMAGLADNATLRKELRGLGVAVFVVKTVREGLKFDTTRLVVEKGKSFQIIFENSDVMPHNLLVVGEGKAVEIGVATMTMGPSEKDKQGRQYVPKNYKLIEGTKLLEPTQKQTIELKAPGKEGTMDFVCTFPGHFMTMHGTIVVAKDVDDYLAKNPTAPALQVLMPTAAK
ncbi:MAG: outer membrane protein precursor, partial [Verrucomicrobiaceae bacterium]|nr:outer membrane protein precursor [Verrucomicrobiaceae bacterium]